MVQSEGGDLPREERKITKSQRYIRNTERADVGQVPGYVTGLCAYPSHDNEVLSRRNNERGDTRQPFAGEPRRKGDVRSRARTCACASAEGGIWHRRVSERKSESRLPHSRASRRIVRAIAASRKLRRDSPPPSADWRIALFQARRIDRISGTVAHLPLAIPLHAAVNGAERDTRTRSVCSIYRACVIRALVRPSSVQGAEEGSRARWREGSGRAFVRFLYRRIARVSTLTERLAISRCGATRRIFNALRNNRGLIAASTRFYLHNANALAARSGNFALSIPRIPRS